MSDMGIETLPIIRQRLLRPAGAGLIMTHRQGMLAKNSPSPIPNKSEPNKLNKPDKLNKLAGMLAKEIIFLPKMQEFPDEGTVPYPPFPGGYHETNYYFLNAYHSIGQ